MEEQGSGHHKVQASGDIGYRYEDGCSAALQGRLEKPEASRYAAGQHVEIRRRIDGDDGGPDRVIVGEYPGQALDRQSRDTVKQPGANAIGHADHRRPVFAGGRAACAGCHEQADEAGRNRCRGHPEAAGLVACLRCGSTAGKREQGDGHAHHAKAPELAAAETLAQEQAGQHEDHHDAACQHGLHNGNRLERQHDDLESQPAQAERASGQPLGRRQQRPDQDDHLPYIDDWKLVKCALFQHEPGIVSSGGKHGQRNSRGGYGRRDTH